MRGKINVNETFHAIWDEPILPGDNARGDPDWLQRRCDMNPVRPEAVTADLFGYSTGVNDVEMARAKLHDDPSPPSSERL